MEWARRRTEDLARNEDIRVRPPRICVDPAIRTHTSVSGRLARRDNRIPIPGTVLSSRDEKAGGSKPLTPSYRKSVEILCITSPGSKIRSDNAASFSTMKTCR